MSLSYQRKKDAGETQRARGWIFRSFLWFVSIVYVGTAVSASFFYLVKNGVSKPNLIGLGSYWETLLSPMVFYEFHLRWISNVGAVPNDWRIFGLPVEMLITFVPASLLMFYMLVRNPYSFIDDTFGSSRYARDDDIKEMGLLDKGWIIVIGEWKGRLLKLPETLSVLCVAPPGTGKTVSVVVPTILTCDNVSMIVNDVKPELFDLTSGYRSKHSLCFRLEWAAQDKPEKGLFFPRWNPLSPMCIPEFGPNRDLYVDRIVNIMIVENEKEPHWSTKARAALAGFVHYIVQKCETGNYQGIPKQWHGQEASIPLIIDWMTEAIMGAQKKKEELMKKNPMQAMQYDPVTEFLKDAANEAHAGGFAPRAVMELTSLAATPDKERGSIMSAMDGGLIVFKNSAVRARTSRSDFSFMDVRGMRDPVTGEMKPVTIYICVNQEDARALGVITGVLIEAMSAWLVAHKPKGKTRDGRDVGPFPVLFVLDEFPQMPKLQALIDGPAVGRGQKVSFLMIGQDLGQIKAKYGENEMETVISTTAAKVILPLNNETTAKRFSEMVGQRTMESKSKSRTVGLSRQTNPFASNMQKSLQGQPLIRPEDFMSLPNLKQHIVLMQANMNRPIMANTPAYFKHPELKHLVYNPEHGMGLNYPPAPSMPPFMIEIRKAEYEEDMRRAEEQAFLNASGDED